MEELIEEIETDSNQYLTFRLGEEIFALEIAKVHEVLEYTKITKVPRMPEFLKGVINLRGNVVPVIDLRMNLGMSAIQNSLDTCIIIVEVIMDGDGVQLGALADSVNEVAEIDPKDIQPPMKLGSRLNTEFIQGMGKQGDDFVIILDIDKVLNASEIDFLKTTTSNINKEDVEEVTVEA